MPGKGDSNTQWKTPVNRAGRGNGWRPRNGRGRAAAGWEGADSRRDELTKTSHSWRKTQDEWAGTPWAINEDPASAWSNPAYAADDGWGQPEEKKIQTMDDLLKSQAQHVDDFIKDLVPFWLKSVDAAERGLPEVKLEAYLEEKVHERKASGWYHSTSIDGKLHKDGDGWSDRKASDNGWGDWGANDAAHGWNEAGPSANWRNMERNANFGQSNGWDVGHRTPNTSTRHQRNWRDTPRQKQSRFG